MTHRPLVSVIIPVYNVAPYLPRCMDSVLNQRYTNLEILLIDDGSTDESGNICDSYAQQDARIRVVHKPNGGLSDARNAGLDVMTGEYVTCIDSDDFVSPYYVENLVTALQHSGADLASSWFINYHEGDALPAARAVTPAEIATLNREDYYRRMLHQDGVEVSAYSKLYRADHFCDVRYPKGKLYEDIPTTYRLVEKAAKIAVIPQADYRYLLRDTSIAHSAFNARKLDAVKHMAAFRDFIKTNYPDLSTAADCRYFSTVCNILFLIGPKEFLQERRQLWGEVKQYRKNVLLDPQSRKKARLGAALSYGGYGLMSRIYRAFNKPGG